MAHPSTKVLENPTFNDMTENTVAHLPTTIHNLTIKRQFMDQCA
jgi:hypothetical protein